MTTFRDVLKVLPSHWSDGWLHVSSRLVLAGFARVRGQTVITTVTGDDIIINRHQNCSISMVMQHFVNLKKHVLLHVGNFRFAETGIERRPVSVLKARLYDATSCCGGLWLCSLSLSLKIQRKAGEDFTFVGEAGECEREANPSNECQVFTCECSGLSSKGLSPSRDFFLFLLPGEQKVKCKMPSFELT